MEKELGSRGYKQNKKKEVLIIGLRGKGSHHLTRHLVQNSDISEAAREARYLGVIVARGTEATTEIRKRVAAMKTAWCEAGEIWWQPIPYKLKRMMIIVSLVNTLVTGIT